jgi:hypothetical protein
MNEAVWSVNILIGVGLLFVAGVIAVIIIEATNE